ncbi:MAG TPA: cardiolipin synthase [Thermoanaerobaculia bacterium]|nr:cardiolipin synthase [Thermoanaerobaculia bacterium]
MTNLARWSIVAVRWAVRLVMVPIVARRHRPNDALAWLALIAALPWIGPSLYFLFGEVGQRRRLRRHAEIRDRLESEERVEEQASWALVSPEEVDGDEDVIEMVRVIDGLNERRTHGLPILAGNRVDLLHDTDEAVDAIVAAIGSARHHVHLLFFIYNPDATGERVAEALLVAARRGVACRVLADDYGSDRFAEPSFFDTLAPRLTAGGVAVGKMLPIRRVRRPFARVDVRNHRKLAVIDGEVAFTGSLNIHDADFHLADGHWVQLTLRLEGPAVHQLQLVFVEDWFFTTGELLDREAHFPPPERCGDIFVQTVPGGPTYESDLMEHMVIAAINNSDRRVIIATPYLVLTEATQIALRLASLRGVRVQVVVPQRSDQRLADLAARSHFASLLDDGVEIHLHQRGLLHAKALSVDDRFALVGTANFDRRSFRVNYELNLALYGHRVARQVRQCQEGFLADATPVDRDEWRARGRRRELLEDTAKLFSPLL